ncbi:TOBE domain-containing protein [Desulfuromonas acetoxidans]|uniref:TOBE domain-containing protein n=1 Tax=Desulfuromonas acetoxidans TaxID=891 RepID=UPI00292FEF0B|nr:TOBE domain-containing protein [Desulfuromonas acetoxidans]
MSTPHSLSGSLWLNKDTHNYLSSKRIALLEQIEATGSLSRAAKLSGMSYKSAWDALAAMNSLAEQPLTEASTGGRDGGGTRLTEAGSRAVQLYRTIEKEHARVLTLLTENFEDYSHLYSLLQRLAMRTSARNTLQGRVVSLRNEGLLTTVEMMLDCGQPLLSQITTDSVQGLALAEQSRVFAMVKAPCLTFVAADCDQVVNPLCGTVLSSRQQGDLIEIELDLGNQVQLSAVVPQDAVPCQQWQPGANLCATIPPSQVMIGIA